MRVYKEDGISFGWNHSGGICGYCGAYNDSFWDMHFWSTYKNLNAFLNEGCKYTSNKTYSNDLCVRCVQRFIAAYGSYNQMLEFWEKINSSSDESILHSILVPYGQKIYLKREDNTIEIQKLWRK